MRGYSDSPNLYISEAPNLTLQNKEMKNMKVFEMDEKTFERWQRGAVAFGREMVKHGIDTMELGGRGVKISPGGSNALLEGILFLGFKRVGLERVEIVKYGNPVSLTEVHVTHTDGESIMKIPDED